MWCRVLQSTNVVIGPGQAKRPRSPLRKLTNHHKTKVEEWTQKRSVRSLQIPSKLRSFASLLMVHTHTHTGNIMLDESDQTQSLVDLAWNVSGTCSVFRSSLWKLYGCDSCFPGHVECANTCKNKILQNVFNKYLDNSFLGPSYAACPDLCHGLWVAALMPGDKQYQCN